VLLPSAHVVLDTREHATIAAEHSETGEHQAIYQQRRR